MRDDRERLAHILEAIEKIEDYAGRGREAFTLDLGAFDFRLDESEARNGGVR